MAEEQTPAVGGSFLESIRREWQLMADSIATESTLLADEANPDFNGHVMTAETRERARQAQSLTHSRGGINNIFVKPFVHGAFSVRNPLRAQSHGPSHGGRDCGHEFAAFGPAGAGPSGPSFGF